LFGTAPKEMAPDLYAKVRFKNRSMHYELNNNRWIQNLGGSQAHISCCNMSCCI
jgi:hypothetical protein